MNNTQDMRKFMDIINENNDPVSDLELEEDTEEIEEEENIDEDVEEIDEENEEELQEDGHMMNSPGGPMTSDQGEVPNSVVLGVNSSNMPTVYAVANTNTSAYNASISIIDEQGKVFLAPFEAKRLCDWLLSMDL